MLPLEIALLTIQAFFTIVTLGGAAVGVVVLLRTSTIKGLAMEVDALTDQVQRFRNRDARRAASPKPKAKSEDPPPEANDGQGFIDEVAQRKAEIEKSLIRR